MSERDAEEMVEVSRETLEQLANFADTYGDEYADRKTYLATKEAFEALGHDNPDPYMVWKSHWGAKPDE